MKSSVARAFFKGNMQRHITKTFKLNGENMQQWFYNVTYANVSFSLLDLPAPELVAIQELYDYYRIDGIKLEFYPQWNSAAGVNLAPEIGMARLTHAVDSNNGNAPATEGEILQYHNAKSPLFSRVIKKYFKAQPQTLAAGQPGNPASMTNPDSKRNYWITTADPNVPHYGIHFNASTMTGIVGETSYRILATFYMTLKGQR